MAFWNRFGKVWASLGGKDPATDAEADQGWDYIGEGPPTTDQFNAVQADLDGKDNWLFAALGSVFARASMAPAQGTPEAFAVAVQNVGVGRRQVFNAPGLSTFTVPSGVTRLLVDVWAAGGGSGAAAGNGSGTGGGGGGAFGSAFCTVTPGQVIQVGVGVAGLGGQFLSSSSASPGNNGGDSSFGGFVTVQGGRGSPSAINGFASTAGPGGSVITFGGGTDGTMAVPGQSGIGPALIYPPTGTVNGGVGGAAGMGNGFAPLHFGSNGGYPHPPTEARSSYPGGGATGTSPNSNGFTGQNGLVIVRW